MKNKLIGFIEEINEDFIKIYVPYKNWKSFLEVNNKINLTINDFLISQNNNAETVVFNIDSLKNYNEFGDSRNDNIEIKCSILGSIDTIENIFASSINNFPSLKSEVYIPNEEILKLIGDISSTEKIKIGSLVSFEKIDVFANPNILFGKHLGVFGNTGSGKSRTIASIIEGIKNGNILLNNKPETKLKPKIITIDPINEFQNLEFYSAKSNFDLTNKNNNFFCKWSYPNFGLDEKELPNLLNFSATGSEITAGVFLTKGEGKVKLIDVLTVMNVNATNQNRCQLDIKKIANLISNENFMEIVESKERNSIIEFLDDSNKEILNLKLTGDNDAQNFLFLLITKTIYKWLISKFGKKKKQLILVIDESHRYLQYNNSSSFSNETKKYLELLIREGRKHNFSLILASQSPSDLDPTIISQCNSFILHKIINKNDYTIIEKVIKNDGTKQIPKIKTLKPQTALISGDAFPTALVIKINDSSSLTTAPLEVINSWK